MASLNSLLSSVLLVLAIVASLASPSFSTSRRALENKEAKKIGFRVTLKHVDHGKNFTKFERLQRAMKRGKSRLQRLNAMVLAAEDNTELESPVHAGNGEFLMQLSMGTPPDSFSAIVDTGSDLIWTQCKPCTQCFDQSTPIFDPKKSSTFSKLACTSQLCEALPTSSCGSDGCEYLYTYGDYSSTQGILASETFTFADSVSIPKVGFGCGENNEGSGFDQGAGLVGLGRGPLSLVSQLGVPKFSYCLTSIDDTKTSKLLMGSEAISGNLSTSAMKTTPLLKNPSQPSFYYLSLEGISEFKSQTKLTVDDSGSTGLDLCFKLPSDTSQVEVPKLIFHFEGADLDLPGENYMIADSTVGLVCLAMGSSNGMSIFGNVQQQNTLVIHDLEKETLSFLPTKCDKL
ncbi:hypothetical protein NL676_019449 [Syzygium grande]|nr:hypothetical protein NL676_019449 [Syzygium grande]